MRKNRKDSEYRPIDQPKHDLCGWEEKNRFLSFTVKKNQFLHINSVAVRFNTSEEKNVIEC